MEHCPRLEALFNEVLRVVLASALMREVIGPTIIGGKVLRPGMKLIVVITIHTDSLCFELLMGVQ